MAGSITDVFSAASSGTAPLATTLTAQKAIGAASASIAASTGMPTATVSVIYFKLYQATSVSTAQGTLLVPVAGTETLWKGLLSGLTINNLTLTSGTDQLYPIGSIVEPMLTSSQWDALYNGLVAEHNQVNGTHTAAAAATIANLFAAGAIPTSKLATDAGLTGGSLANTTIPYNKLLATIFSSQVTSYTNPGSAGGSFYYVNLGGIKLFWGTTAVNATGTGGTSPIITLPSGFFTTLQTVLPTLGVLTVDAKQFASINAQSTSSITLTLLSQTNGSSQSTNILIIGT